MEDLPRQLKLDSRSYLVLTTRGSSVDVVGLPARLATPATYVGVIGSRRRWATTVKELEAGGVSAAQIGRVHSPMGLELRAETPEEIAVSIMAEILMLRDNGSGASMSAADS
jgi:xanthine dehydrogenase accessory factor